MPCSIYRRKSETNYSRGVRVIAFQGYRHKSDRTVGENESSPTKVAGRPEMQYRDGTENLTPPPVKAFDPLTARDSAWGRATTGSNNPGKNSFNGPVSTPPGAKADPADVNPQAGTDLVLDAVVKGGAHGAQVSDDWQTRNSDFTSEQADPTAKGMRSRNNEGGTIPKKIGASILDNSAARRAAMLRIGQGK